MEKGVTLRIDDTRPFLKGFADYYASDIFPALSALEGERRKVVGEALWLFGGGAALIVIGLIFYLLLPESGGLTTLIIAGVAAAAVILWGLAKITRLKSSVKGTLMDKVCAFLGLRHSERPSGFPFARFRDLGLVPRHDRKNLEDQISGRHDEVDFDLIEAKLQQRRRTKNRTYYVTVFNGLLAHYSFPKDFNGRTVITRDGGFIGNFFEGFGREERIRLEDPRFEREFEVYGTDQVEARYLLTPTFMERLLALGKTVGRRAPELAFQDNRLLIAVESPGNRFEGGSVFRPLTDPKRVEALIDELIIIYDIIDILRLNLRTRI